MILFRSINIALYGVSLAVLCALIYSAKNARLDSRGEEKAIRASSVFACGTLCMLVSVCLLEKAGMLVRFLLILFISGAFIFRAYGIVLYISYLFNIGRNDFTGRSPESVLLNLIWLLSATQMIHVCINLFTHDMFYVTASNMLVNGPLFRVNNLLALVQAVLMIVLAGVHKDFRVNRRLLLILGLLPAAAICSSFFFRSAMLIYPSFTLSLLMIYVNVYLQQEHQLRQREIELSESRFSLLIGQIQPHFIFNVLNTIYYLCDTDAETAAKAAHDFNLFLQDSTDKKEYDRTVPFAQELESVIHYTNLEKLRFDQIEIVYDIKTDDFRIPPLTVQPLVENAIRHGCREMDGGRVIISAKKEKDGYAVEVIDNGTGYSDESRNDGRVHVGIENVRNRLSIVSGASLTISALDPAGTCARIFIPEA